MRPSATSAVPYLRLYNDSEIQTLEASSGNYATVMDFTAADSSVNYIQVDATATGNMPVINATGSDTDVDIILTPKGAGLVDVTSVLGVAGEIELIGANKWIAAEAPDTNVYQVMGFMAQNASVNYVQVNATPTGIHPGVEANGTDTDINIQMVPKGTGFVQAVGHLQLDTDLIIDSGGNSAIGIGATGSAVNYVQFTNAATGNTPTIDAVGTDADIHLALVTKGTGKIGLTTDVRFDGTTIFDVNENELVGLTTTASAVNNVQIANAAAGNPPSVEVVGDDADIDLDLQGKGTGNICAVSDLQLDTGNIMDANGNEAIVTTATASAINHVKITNGAAGNGATIEAEGDDTDVDLNLTAQGAGGVIVEGFFLRSDGTSDSITFVASRQTTDDTVTDLTAVPIEEGEVVSIEVDVVGLEGDQSNRAAYKLAGLFYRNTAGNVTQQGATTSISTIESDANWNCDLVADAGNQTIDVTVLGALATTVDWSGTIKDTSFIQ